MNELTKLLATDGFIQVNKSLIRNIGLHEAIIIGELCAEYNYWASEGKLDDDMFYSTRDNIENNTGLNDHFQRKAIKNLQEFGILQVTKKGLPAVNYYRIVYDKLLESLTCSPTRDEALSGTRDEALQVNLIEINNNKENNNKNNNKEKISPAASTSSFLGSNKQTKQPNLYQSCIAMINDFTDDKRLRDKLVFFLDMMLEQQRLKGRKQFSGMLNGLATIMNGNIQKGIDTVQYSIEGGYAKFYERNDNNRRFNRASTIRDIEGIPEESIQRYTDEERRQIKEDLKNGKYEWI